MKMEVQYTKIWDAAKAVLKTQFIMINAYIKNGYATSCSHLCNTRLS